MRCVFSLYITRYHKPYRVTSQRENDILCQPCLSGQIQTLAKIFCKTCEDPEPMCDVCGNMHLRMKATKHHELSNDLRQYPFQEKTSEMLWVLQLIFKFLKENSFAIYFISLRLQNVINSRKMNVHSKDRLNSKRTFWLHI